MTIEEHLTQLVKYSRKTTNVLAVERMTHVVALQIEREFFMDRLAPLIAEIVELVEFAESDEGGHA